MDLDEKEITSTHNNDNNDDNDDSDDNSSQSSDGSEEEQEQQQDQEQEEEEDIIMDVEVELDPMERMNDVDKNDQVWIVKELKSGDRIEIFDEEMGWWETGTIQEISSNFEEISFQFDENMDKEWPNNVILSTKGNTYNGSVEDFEHARFGTFTIQSVKPLLFPRNLYIPNNQIMSVFDIDGVEWLFIGSKQMNDDSTVSSHSQLMTYNCNKDKFEVMPHKTVHDIFKIKGNTEKLYYQHLLRSGIIEQMVKHLLGIDKKAKGIDDAEDIDDDEDIDDEEEEDIGFQTAFVPKTNTIHLLCQNEWKSYYAKIKIGMFPDDKNKRLVPGYRVIGGKRENDLNRADGKLIYIPHCNNLMYFGGIDLDKGYYSQDIWYLDLDENESQRKWRLYELGLPRPYDNDFNVIVHGDLAFVIYTTSKSRSSRNIYLYDLINSKIWQSSKKFPGPYKGKAMAIKTDSNMTHFFNGSQHKDEINMNRPYHFKMCLTELIPSRLWEIHAAKYKKITAKYIYHHLHGYNRGLSLQIVSTVMKYFPVFA